MPPPGGVLLKTELKMNIQKTNTKKILVGIRTNNFTLRSFYIACYYKSRNIDVIFVVDETKGVVDTGYFEKISFNNERLHELGLFKSHSQIGWLCGDYFHYMMALDKPEYDGYWLVEDDAILLSKNIITVMNSPLESNVDFIAHFMSEADGKFLTGWANSMKEALDSPLPLMKCIFCVTYASQNLILEALKYRQEASKLYIEGSINKFDFPFPNDESHMMNIPSRNEFNYQPMTKFFPGMCDNYHYSSHGVIYEVDFKKTETEDGFYHPIRLNIGDASSITSHLELIERQDPALLENQLNIYSKLLSDTQDAINLRFAKK